MEEKCKGCKKAIEELTNYWIRSLFEFKFCYIDDIGCLACVLSQESPKEICDMFDIFVYFQNSCDQDYDYKEWGDITYFKKQIEFIKLMTKEQFTKWYKENIDGFFEEEYAIRFRPENFNSEVHSKLDSIVKVLAVYVNQDTPYILSKRIMNVLP